MHKTFLYTKSKQWQKLSNYCVGVEHPKMQYSSMMILTLKWTLELRIKVAALPIKNQLMCVNFPYTPIGQTVPEWNNLTSDQALAVNLEQSKSSLATLNSLI